MKKTLLTFLLILATVATCCGAFSVAAENAQSANAAENEPVSENLELLLPGSYEQYLELNDPSDIAVNDDYIAIADRSEDGNSSVIYIYDVARETYRVLNDAGKSPKSLCFYKKADGATILFYVINDNSVYFTDLSAEALDKTIVNGFHCYSMIIANDTVFLSRTNQASASIYKSEIAFSENDVMLSEPTEIRTFSDCSNPNFAIAGENVYLAINTNIYIYNGSEFVLKREFVNNTVESFAVYRTAPFSFYYTTGSKNLYDVTEQDQSRYNADGLLFSTLKSFGSSIYLLCTTNNSVKQIVNGTFTDYEIGKYSDSPNRLAANANDISVYKDNVVIADTQNQRVLIRSAESGNYISVETGSPTLVCAGKQDFVVSDSHAVYIYSYDGTQQQVFPAASGTLIGCAFAYGNYYLIGTNSASCILVADNNGYTRQSSSVLTSPTSVTADIYGNIYVLQNNSVYHFTEQTFADGSSDKIAFTAPAGTTKILSDYSGNVYAVTDSGIYILNETNYLFVLSSETFSGLLYDLTSPALSSFAFGFEDSAVYILSDGFIVKADLGANAPLSLNNIAADTLYNGLHGSLQESDAANMLVTVPENSVILYSDTSEEITESTSVFPYASYEKTQAERVGLRICDTQAGTVVAFFEYVPAANAGDPPARNYTLCLVLGNALNVAAGYANVRTPFTGYTTNPVGLYRFPLMQIGQDKILSNGIRLEKSAQMLVLGTISSLAGEQTPGFGLDCDYYFVRIGKGETAQYGFIPQSYVIDFSAPGSWDAEEFSFRRVDNGKSITLYSGEESLTLSDREQVKVYGSPDADGLVLVTYEKDGVLWSGMVDESLLYEASPSVLIVFLIIMLVTTMVLVSTCYLLLRKQPTQIPRKSPPTEN